MRRDVLYFGIGAVAGSSVTALFFLIKEGIIFAGEGTPYRHDDTPVPEHEDSEKPVPFKDVPTTEQSSQTAYHNILHANGYDTTDAQVNSGVYTVTEEDYFEGGREGDYDMRAIAVYSDGVVADLVSDQILELGDMANAFGSLYTTESLMKTLQSVDVIYVRNDRLTTQYEITYDDRTYEEVTGQEVYG